MLPDFQILRTSFSALASRPLALESYQEHCLCICRPDILSMNPNPLPQVRHSPSFMRRCLSSSVARLAALYSATAAAARGLRTHCRAPANFHLSLSSAELKPENSASSPPASPIACKASAASTLTLLLW